MYLADAEAERDSQKKSELYHLAEGHLQLACRLYAKSGFPRKEAETRKHLKSIIEEKGLLSPAEVLGDSPVAHDNRVSLALHREKPLGLERFQTVRLWGQASIMEKPGAQGAVFTLNLELTNMGKESATLIRIEDIVPEGLEAEGAQGRSLDLKEKRLDYLKTHKVAVDVRAPSKGMFEIRPKVILVDDKGNQSSFEFEPTAVVAKNASERLQVATKDMLSKHVPASFFESKKTREVFEHLSREFLRDYMTKGLYVEKSGWRTLMELVRALEISKASMYGFEGRDGPVLAELDRKGVIERRIFTEERGRGGAVTRIRVAYDNPFVRSIVKETIVESL